MGIPAHKGQGLNETAMVVALVGIVSIGGLMFFSDQLFAVWNGYKFGDPRAAALANSNTVAVTNTKNVQIQGLNQGNGKGVKVTLADGTVLDLGSYPANLSRSVETSGVNGTTDDMLASLDAIAKSLEKDGKLTPEQASIFAELSNRGHKIADIEKITEALRDNCGSDRNCFMGTPVTYDGVKYRNAWELSVQQVGYTEDTLLPDDQWWKDFTDNGIMFSGNWGVSSQNFLNEYNRLQKSGALNDPTVASIVAGLVNNVTSLADNYETTTFTNIFQGNAVPSDLKSLVAANTTHNDAAGICTTGNGQDNGVHCQ